MGGCRRGRRGGCGCWGSGEHVDAGPEGGRCWLCCARREREDRRWMVV